MKNIILKVPLVEYASWLKFPTVTVLNFFQNEFVNDFLENTNRYHVFVF